MSFMDNLKNIRNVMRAYDEQYIENEEELEESIPEASDEAEEEFTEPKPRFGMFSRKESRYEDDAPAAAPGKKTFLIMRPVDFDEAADIADNLKARKAVLINLEATDVDTARRLLDFLSGVVYSLGGKIVRVSSQAYMLTPSDVVLVGDDIPDLLNSGFSF